MRSLALIPVFLTLSCGPHVEFRGGSKAPRSPLVESAVHIYRLGPLNECGASSLGALTMAGHPLEITMPRFAEEAADRGATHFVVTDRRGRGDVITESSGRSSDVVVVDGERYYRDGASRGSARTRKQRDALITAALYRLDKHSWTCAGFAPADAR